VLLWVFLLGGLLVLGAVADVAGPRLDEPGAGAGLAGLPEHAAAPSRRAMAARAWRHLITRPYGAHLCSV
jgi:hypothetical protein